MKAGINGPPKKPEKARKGHRKYEITQLPRHPDGPVDVPEYPTGTELLAATKRDWDSFWTSPLRATVVLESDMPAVVRLFALRDEYERVRREFRKNRIVAGSQGQAVLNPLGAFMLQVAKEIRALEDRFGLSAVSRLRLQVELNEASKSLDELNRRMAEDTEEDDSDEDPRLQAIDVDSASS